MDWERLGTQKSLLCALIALNLEAANEVVLHVRSLTRPMSLKYPFNRLLVTQIVFSDSEESR